MNNIGAQVGPNPKITANYEPRPMIISALLAVAGAAGGDWP